MASYQFNMAHESIPLSCFLIRVVRKAIQRVHEESHPYEHSVSSIISALLQHYFPITKGWLITPEQRQMGGKIPDFVIEGLDFTNSEDPVFQTHIYVECKKEKGSSFLSILGQLSKQMIETADESHSMNLFAIAIRGTKITFLEYHNYRDHVVERGIPHFLGLIPLQLEDYPGPQEMIRLKVESYFNPEGGEEGREGEIPGKDLRLDMWDLNNPEHHPYIHRFFEHMALNQPRYFSK